MARHNKLKPSGHWLNWLDLDKYAQAARFDLFDWAQQLVARARLRDKKGDFLQKRFKQLKDAPLEVPYMQPVIPLSRPLRPMTHLDVRTQQWLYGLPGVKQQVETWDLAHGKQDHSTRVLASVFGNGGVKRLDLETEKRLASEVGNALRTKLQLLGDGVIESSDQAISDIDEEILRLADRHPGGEFSDLQGPHVSELRCAAAALWDGHKPFFQPIQVDGVPLDDVLADMLGSPPASGEQDDALQPLVDIVATPFLRVDLRYGRDTLVAAFENWLDATRERFKNSGVEALAPPKSGKDQERRRPVLKFTEGAMGRWCKQQILPYLDIMLLSEIEGIAMPRASDIADALFPDDPDAQGLRIVEKELPQLAQLLLNKDTTNRLLLEGAAQRAGVRT